MGTLELEGEAQTKSESKQQSCIECSALYIDVSYMIFNNAVIMAKT